MLSEAFAVGCDIYNCTISGDKAVTLTANSCSSAGHAGPTVIVLNDHGSKSNNIVTEDGTAQSLLAMRGHDVHVVSFEP